MSRILGVDYGTKRIGLAISDGIRLTARPLDVVDPDDLIDKLKTVRDELGFELVVMGMPTGLGGNEGVSAEGARRLGDRIAEEFDIEVLYVDERFTSRMADSALLEAGMKRRSRKETVDKVAAAIILQTYLDSEARGNSGPGQDVE